MNAAEYNPGELLQISGYFWKTCALHTGVKLDVFTTIGEEALTGAGIAQKLQTDERATAMFLNALAAMGLLRKKKDMFSNTPSSLKFLSKSSPQYIGYMIMHHAHLVDSWNKLDEGVRGGGPLRERTSVVDDENRREAFLMGMFNMGMSIGPQLAQKIDLADRSQLLDLGGGPGTYAIHFCLANPRLKATVFDLPTTRPFAEKTIAKFDLSDRIGFQSGSYLTDDIQGGYDVAWLSHILHAEGPENCQNIIQKAVSALKPGGQIIIHEFILKNTMDGPLFPALFALNMLLGTEGGQSYSEAQLKEMLETAGVKDIKRLPWQGPTESGILAGFVA